MGFFNSIANFGSGLVSATLGAISASKQRRFEQEEAEKERLWSESMQEKQNQWNLEQWNRTNEYNSPSAQRQRLEDAGLNPLYFGLDGSSANGLESAQPLGYERASMSGIDNPVLAGLNSALLAAQISNVQADTAKKNNENVSVTAERERIVEETNKLRQEIQNLLSNKENTEAQTKVLQKTLAWTDRINEAAIHLNESQANLNESTKKRLDLLLEGEKIIQSKNIQDFEYKWKKIDKEIEKLAVDTKIAKKDLQYYLWNHMSQGLFGTGINIFNIFRSFLNADSEGNIDYDIGDDSNILPTIPPGYSGR